MTKEERELVQAKLHAARKLVTECLAVVCSAPETPVGYRNLEDQLKHANKSLLDSIEELQY